ncbi:hypothetical protein [uncultured Roseivirga sp.]|uniref:hypothetical protein n=1 Tax=uncultured Roseivirga sp. TaxID=543088 RepID=UPI0032B20E2C|tara:strand:+ start:3732 stop:4028 length:297 start_codon:yes stop_codon:yes gene_type:complete
MSEIRNKKSEAYSSVYDWDNVKETKQDWQFTKYCSKERKWLMRPVFSVKFKWSNRFERISITEAMENIFCAEHPIFSVSDDLRKWIATSKRFSHYLNT